MKLTDEAVEAALDVLLDDGHNGLDCRPDRNLSVSVRAALEAALPHLEGATPVAERIATVIEEYADDLEPPTTVDWLELRSWFKGLLHEAAARAREIGGAS